MAQHVQLESQHTQFDIIPDSKDPQIINGTQFTILNRSTFCDFCEYALDHEVSHSFHLKDNYIMVMPRTVRDTLPDAPMARLAGDKLLSSGMELRQNFLQAGILYMMDPEEERQLGLACLSHREHAGEQRSEQFARFCDSIGVLQTSLVQSPCSLSRNIASTSTMWFISFEIILEVTCPGLSCGVHVLHFQSTHRVNTSSIVEH